MKNTLNAYIVSLLVVLGFCALASTLDHNLSSAQNGHRMLLAANDGDRP